MTIKTPDILERYRTEIDSELKSVVTSRESPLYDMMRYHLGWIDENGAVQANSAGKALRPTLCLLACQAAGGDYRQALPVAAGLELLHNFSLIHDDIQDNDRERRHRPTVWAVWGMPQAINAGTAMRILTNTALARLGKLGVELEKILKIQQLLDEATLQLIEGQYLDISYEKRMDIGVDDYLTMIGGKTAALIACALETGALLGTDNPSTIEQYRNLGMNLGFGFQIRDDILGIWGDSKVTGKPLGNDILRRKKTLPIVRALTSVKDGHKHVLEEFFRNETDDRPLPRILALLDDIGAHDYACEMADGYCRKARNIVEGLFSDAAVKDDFNQLIDFLEERTF